MNGEGRVAALEKQFRFRVYFFGCPFSSQIFSASLPVNFSSPFYSHCSMVFIVEVLLGFQTSPSTFPFLFFL